MRTEVDPAGDKQRKTSARGLRRKQLLLDAAGELILQRGFAAVSHRAVAQHAGLPLAATTYYFASLDELLAETVHHLARSWLDTAQREVTQPDRPLRDSRLLAEALIRVAAPVPVGSTDAGRTALLSLYERYVEAARQPQLRAVIAEYDLQIEKLLANALHLSTDRDVEAAGRLLLAVIDGALLRALAEGADPSSAVPTVQCLVELLTARNAGDASPEGAGNLSNCVGLQDESPSAPSASGSTHEETCPR